jgi:hypothetical protein
MRLQLIDLRLRHLAAAVVAAAAASAPGAARADDRVDVRGVYYKETSNRILYPRVDLETDLPRGITVDAYYQLDTITSASIAQGNALDNAQTEYRSEIGGAARKRLGDWLFGAGYRNSHESDYLSWGLQASVARDLAEKNATVSLGYSYLHDSVRSRARQFNELGTLDGSTLSLYLTQLLSPVAIAEVGYEMQYLDGFQANAYRRPMGIPERHPTKRDRHTLAGRIAYLFPQTGTTPQVWYRYYFDGWNIRAHAIEPRVYQDLWPGAQLRLTFRYYTQTAAYFWKDLAKGETYPPCPAPGQPGADSCGITGDDKMRPFDSYFVEAQLRVALAPLESVPLLGWFRDGFVDLSYASFFQHTSWGSCGPGQAAICEDRVLQLGLSVPF